MFSWFHSPRQPRPKMQLLRGRPRTLWAEVPQGKPTACLRAEPAKANALAGWQRKEDLRLEFEPNWL